jgi:hypothetical protein
MVKWPSIGRSKGDPKPPKDLRPPPPKGPRK